MPIYEYTCEQCGKDFDYLAKSMAASADLVPCPSCGSGKTKRRLSVPMVRAQEGSSSGHAHGPMCACGRPPGSCGMMN